MPGHIFRTLPLASTYTYDGAGNRTVKHLTRDGGPSTRTTCVYDGANQLDYCLEGSDRTTYSYDPAGNLEKVEDPSGALTTHTWDDENRRITVELPDDDYVHTATYNADGLRVAKEMKMPASLGTTWSLPDPSTYRYVWDGQDLASEYIADGATKRAKLIYTFKPESPFGRLVNIYQPVSTADPVSDQLWEYQYDALGSTSHVVGLGNVTGSPQFPVSLTAARCDAFGGFIIGPYDGFFGLSHRYFIAERNYQADIRFGSDAGVTAHFIDYYVRARTYDPAIARWLSRDPIGFGGGDYNLYRYVMNSPLILLDPSGNRPQTPHAKIPFFVVGGYTTPVKNVIVPQQAHWEPYVVQSVAHGCCMEVGLNVTYDLDWWYVEEFTQSVPKDEWGAIAEQYAAVAA
ncbi:MAG: hypothetical protein DWQ31_09355 [Planctomycetota bacterium]|nr:MAG: hypothetical protein DWQ31_09355 [Planctomycetota bacterium]REK18534.1 MAG: hypothetical protein DWQ42_20275 [Planctomycetota bacterium]